MPTEDLTREDLAAGARAAQEKALAVRPQGLGVVARDQYDPRQVGLLASLAPKGMEPLGKDRAVFSQWLELAQRYQLDPFMRQIWLARMGGRDGSDGQYVVMVGRDGLLAYANRQPDFEGIEGDVVYENDDFSKSIDPATRLPVVNHVVGKPGDRGSVIGAWSIAYRSQRKPIYFFAAWDQYAPKSEAKMKASPWSNQADAMILKCSQSTCLRLLYSLSGFVPAEEVSARVTDESAPADEFADIEWGDDPSLGDWMARLFIACNELEEGAYRPAKIKLKLAGLSDTEREELASSELLPFIDKRGGVIPERTDVTDGEAVEELQLDTEPMSEVPFGED